MLAAVRSASGRNVSDGVLFSATSPGSTEEKQQPDLKPLFGVSVVGAEVRPPRHLPDCGVHIVFHIPYINVATMLLQCPLDSSRVVSKKNKEEAFVFEVVQLRGKTKHVEMSRSHSESMFFFVFFAPFRL